MSIDPSKEVIEKIITTIANEYVEDYEDCMSDIYKDLLNTIERINIDDVTRVNILNEVFIAFHSSHISRLLAVYTSDIQESILVGFQSKLKRQCIQTRKYFLQYAREENEGH